MSEIKSCEVCGARSLRSAINLGLHPMCDDLVPIGNEYLCKEYPIDILYCETCRTAHQRFQIPKRELFPSTYHYRSRHTADVLNGMKDLVAGIEARFGDVRSKKVLDIGCNDGSLLSFFAERGGVPFGIEPTGAALDAVVRGYTIVNDFFSEDVAAKFVGDHGQPDIITFTNVFAHIENLNEVVRALKLLIHDNTAIIIENHYLGSILDKNQFDTFYHEHPRTYSLTSFKYIANALGLSLVGAEFPKRYGGNIRVMLSIDRRSDGIERTLENMETAEQAFGVRLDQLAANVERWRKNKAEELRVIVSRHGSLRAKAFPGRAAIPIKILQLSTTQISAAYEKPGSAKVGHYVPGTRIPIRSDDEFDTGQAGGPVLNLAWHISDEIKRYLQDRGYAGPIIDIISPEDFR